MNFKYTNEFIEQFASQFDLRVDFAKANPSIYTIACRRGILDHVCRHMKRLRPKREEKPKEYWTREEAKAALDQCDTKKEFRERFPRAYSHAVRHGYWKEISDGKETLGDFYLRRIYIFEFSDHHAYVGLSCDPNRRQVEHMRKSSPVGDYILNHDVDWDFNVITDWLDKDTAGKIEEETIERYKADGWILLNKAPGGGLGHARDPLYTIEQIAEVAVGFEHKKEFKAAYPNLYDFAFRHKFLDKVCKHMTSGRKKPSYWTKDRLDIVVTECKRPTIVFKKYPGAIKAIRNQGLYEHYFGHSCGKKRKMTLEFAIEECKKYKSPPEVFRKDRALYNNIYKHGWQEQCYGQYGHRQASPKAGLNMTWEKVKAAIEASSTFKEFRIDHPIEYRAAMRHEDWREKLYQLLPNRFHNPKK